MGVGVSFSINQFTSELSRRGIESDGVIEQLAQVYMDSRHEEESKLYRENVIALVKQFDLDTKDEKIGKSLLALSEKVFSSQNMN